MTNSPLHRRTDAAAYVRNKFGIPCASSTLDKLAVTGGGPEITYVGRWPMYAETALDAWVASKTRAARSTSERPAAPPLQAAE